MPLSHLRIIALFLLLPVLFFWPALAAGSLLGPGDGLAQFLPGRVLAVQALAQGEMPFWNPFTFSGMPLLATPQVGVFFPGNWPFLVLPPVAAFNLTVLLAFSLAGYATYAFCRGLETSRAGAVAAGLTFMFSGFMVGHVVHLSVLQAAALIPALLWAVERYARTLAQRYAVAGCLLLALGVLSGHPQTLAYGFLPVGAYALWRAIGMGAGRWRFLGGLVVGGGLAVGLSLVQLLPAIDYIPLTQRSAFSYQQLLHDSLPPRQLATLLFPYLFGATGSPVFTVPYWGAGTDAVEAMAYAGLAGLALAIAALFTVRREPQVRFWLVVLVVAVMLACGDATPLFKLTTLIPPYSSMRAPGRHLLEAHLAIAMLVAFALSWVQAGAPGALRRLQMAVGLVSVGLVAGVGLLGLFGGAIAARLQPYFSVDLATALAVRQPAVWVPLLVGVALVALVLALPRLTPPGRASLLVAFIGLDLGFFGRHMDWNTLRPEPPVLPAYPVDAFLPGEGRLLAVTDRFGYFSKAAMRDLALPGPSAIAGIRSAGGYDAFIYRRYSTLFGGLTSGGAGLTPALVSRDSHVLDILGVRQIRLDARLQADGAWPQALAASGYTRTGQWPESGVYTNPRALPRAWRPEAAQVMSAEEVDRRLTTDPGFDPRRLALLDSGAAPAASPGTATAEARGFNRIVGSTSGKAPGLVIVSESYDPGWRATAGGRALPVHRVDGVLLGVAVPSGPVSFELRYEPPRWRLALLGTGVSALLLLIWAWWGARRPRAIAIATNGKIGESSTS